METIASGRCPRCCLTCWLPRLLLSALLWACASPIVAADPAGRVISLVGTVRADNAAGDTRVLARGDTIHAGDMLTLGPHAHAQIRMRDDALVELEADARFAIPVYSESADGGSVLMRLLHGAMRTITGTIGDGPDQTYQVDTPVATIGVRGTEYALHYCNGGCAGEDRDRGLYGRVDAGAVLARNQAARRVFREREYFYVAARDVAPREIVRPPPGILAGGAVSRGTLRRGDAERVGGEFAAMDPGDDAADTDLGDDLDSTVDSTRQTLGNTADGAGEFTGDTLGGASELTGDTLSGTGELAGDTLGGDLDAGETLDDTTDLTGDTVDGTTDLADDTLDGAGDVLGTTVDDTTDTLDDATNILDND